MPENVYNLLCLGYLCRSIGPEYPEEVDGTQQESRRSFSRQEVSFLPNENNISTAYGAPTMPTSATRSPSTSTPPGTWCYLQAK